MLVIFPGLLTRLTVSRTTKEKLIKHGKRKKKNKKGQKGSDLDDALDEGQLLVDERVRPFLSFSSLFAALLSCQII